MEPNRIQYSRDNRGFKSCAPYSYQGYLRIQNTKVSSWALNFQNLQPKTDPGSSTNSDAMIPGYKSIVAMAAAAIVKQ